MLDKIMEKMDVIGEIITKGDGAVVDQKMDPFARGEEKDIQKQQDIQKRYDNDIERAVRAGAKTRKHRPLAVQLANKYRNVSALEIVNKLVPKVLGTIDQENDDVLLEKEVAFLDENRRVHRRLQEKSAFLRGRSGFVCYDCLPCEYGSEMWALEGYREVTRAEARYYMLNMGNFPRCKVCWGAKAYF